MLESMRVIIWFSPMEPSLSVSSACPPSFSASGLASSSVPATLPTIMDVMSNPVLMICRG